MSEFTGYRIACALAKKSPSGDSTEGPFLIPVNAENGVPVRGFRDRDPDVLDHARALNVGDRHGSAPRQYDIRAHLPARAERGRAAEWRGRHPGAAPAFASGVLG